MFDRRGESRAPVLFYIFLAIIVGYICIKTIPPYIAYYSMEDEVNQLVEFSKMNSQEVLKGDLLKHAEDLDIPLEPENVSITQLPGGNVEISIEWTDYVDYGYGFYKEFPFEIQASSFASTGGKEE